MSGNMSEWIEVNQFWSRPDFPRPPNQDEHDRLNDMRNFRHYAEIESMRRDLNSRPEDGPEWDQWRQAMTERRAIIPFRSRLRVGMLIELQTGQRILVGDCSPEYFFSEGGDELPDGSFVVRYRMVDLGD